MHLPKIKFPLVFIKFGDLHHIQELRERGRLYCKSIHYFKDVEDSILRGDPDEHVTKYEQIAPGTIMTLSATVGVNKGKEIKVRITKGVYKEHSESPLGNIFCMSSMRLSQHPLGDEFTIHTRCREFGSHFLLILDTEKFFERLDKAIDAQKLVHKRGFVEYFDLSQYTGERDLLQKDVKYSYQNEYRIVFTNDNFDHLDVYLGSLEDISRIYSADSINIFKLMVQKGGVIENQPISIDNVSTTKRG